MLKEFPIDRLMNQRYRYNLRKIKNICEQLNINLKEYNDAYKDDICIISYSDFELYSTKQNCCSQTEGYFINESDYEKFKEFEESCY